VNGRLGCLQVRRTLQSFLDGEVEPHRAELVAAHLESCSRCHVEADLLADVIEAIRRLRPDLDLAAYTRLVDAVQEVTEPHGPA
jgi:anti-sigma factor (TIGR02949 family)